MTLNTFISTYNGKKLDWDNAYGGQCTDLFRFYVHEVLDKPQPKPVVGAADFWTNYDIDPNLKNNFEKILNTPVNVPKAGDVMIWSKKAGQGFGHVGVFIEGDVNRFKSFDQNWRALNVSEPTEHNYTNVLGWLRPREETMAETIQVEKAVFENLVTKATKYDEIVKAGYVTKADHDKRVDELNAQNNSHINEITALQKENAQLKQDLEDCESHEPDTDPAGWVKNGLTKEEVVGGTKWITNYKRA